MLSAPHCKETAKLIEVCNDSQKEFSVSSKCEKNEQVTVPTAWDLLITIQSTQRENAKGRKESDSLNRMPLWTGGCNANNP